MTYVDVSGWLTIGVEERSQMRTGSIWHRPDEPLLVRQTHQAAGQQKSNCQFHLFIKPILNEIIKNKNYKRTILKAIKIKRLDGSQYL